MVPWRIDDQASGTRCRGIERTRDLAWRMVLRHVAEISRGAENVHVLEIVVGEVRGRIYLGDGDAADGYPVGLILGDLAEALRTEQHLDPLR